MERTAPLRRDFAPFIHEVVRVAMENMIDLAAKEKKKLDVEVVAGTKNENM